jgi:kynurenine formamidase
MIGYTAMSERAVHLANQLREAGAALIRTVSEVDDAHWARVPVEGVWSAGKDAEHLSQGAVYHQWLVRTALGETLERGAGTQRDVMTALLSRSEVLAVLQQRTEDNARLLESLSDEQLARPAPPLSSDGLARTVQQLIEGQMIRHYREHQWNIEAKLHERVPHTRPTQAELLAWMATLSNWGRWGSDDQRGTLNLVDAQVTLRATQLVREGVTVSCARPWSYEGAPDVDPRRVPQHYMLASGEAYRPGEGPDRQVALDFIGVAFHGRTVTHIDSLAHFFWDGRLYNGAAAQLVRTMDGATSHAVANAHGGIVTRGILVDAAWLRGVDAIAPGEGVGLADFESARDRCGIQPMPGDVVLVRTGQLGRRDRIGPLPADAGSAGPLPEILPLLREHDVAVLGSDTGNDVVPTGYERFSNPVHQVGIVAMGLWILDNAWLDDLAEACRARGRWEFLFTILPLRIPNATGSPVNPVAIF